ncbi:hypothetical protein MLD38_036544 [Melastoma candidum]|uniref:Uncharacterized protein n=1 Tax=Melastoma candidum TaxID=119954 RepID=A0ACB9LK01_9MYRT|nr:hypothetical protein MLD38_036544 [Melastoma candidum]
MSRELPPEGSLDERIRRAYQAHDLAEVLRLNTEGIALYPQDPRYYINRAAAKVSTYDFHGAIADGINGLLYNQDRRVHPAVPYLYMVIPLIGLSDFDSAFAIAEEVLKIDPEVGRIKACKEVAEVAGIYRRTVLGRSAGMDEIGDMFNAGEMWLKLERDAVARDYRHDPEFRRKLYQVRNDNQQLGKHLREDKRFLEAFGILLNVRFGENIGRVEPEANFERNEVLPQEKLHPDLISAIVGCKLPDMTKVFPPIGEQKRVAGKTTEEQASEELEASLVKELAEMALEGATFVEEKAKDN